MHSTICALDQGLEPKTIARGKQYSWSCTRQGQLDKRTNVRQRGHNPSQSECRWNLTHPYIHTHTQTYIPIYLPTYIPTYLGTYVPTYLRTHVHTYIPTYIHTYIHTYQHTNIPPPQATGGGTRRTIPPPQATGGRDQKDHTTIHPSIRMHPSIHTYIYTHTDMHTYLLTYLPTYIPTYLRTYVPTYTRTYIYTHTDIHTYLPTYLHTYLPTYLHTYIPTYLRTYVPTYTRTYIHTYIPTYQHTNIPTYHHHRPRGGGPEEPYHHPGGDHGGGGGGLGVLGHIYLYPHELPSVARPLNSTRLGRWCRLRTWPGSWWRKVARRDIFFGSNGHGDGYFLMEMVVECWEMGEISPFGMVIFQYFPWLNGWGHGLMIVGKGNFSLWGYNSVDYDYEVINDGWLMICLGIAPTNIFGDYHHPY